MTNTNDMRAAFQDFRDQRNKELAANGHGDQSKFWITNAHYTAWCRGIEWQSQQAQGATPVAEVIHNFVGVDIAWCDPPSSGRPPVGTKLFTLPCPPAKAQVPEGQAIGLLARVQGWWQNTDGDMPASLEQDIASLLTASPAPDHPADVRKMVEILKWIASRETAKGCYDGSDEVGAIKERVTSFLARHHHQQEDAER